jgi:hypothetical protein
MVGDDQCGLCRIIALLLYPLSQYLFFAECKCLVAISAVTERCLVWHQRLGVPLTLRLHTVLIGHVMHLD